MNEPSVYIHWGGWNLSGWMRLYEVGMGVMVGLLMCVMGILGAVFHALESLTLYCRGVGLMGWVSMRVFIVWSRVCFNMCGVWVLGVRVVWLCMHISDVSDGSTYW